MIGSFNEEAQAVWDFVRCQRADGTFYGTGGTCRKGNETGAKEKEAPKVSKKRVKEAIAKATPEQKKALKEAIEQRKSGAYTPKEASGPTGEKADVKKGIFGDNKTFDPDALRKRADEVAKDKKLKKWDREERVEDLLARAKQAEKSKEFLDNLSKNVPKGTKLEAEENMVVMTTKTKSGDTVQTTYSPNTGYNFKVNDSYSAGNVTDRRAQLEIAGEVRKQYDAFVKSLPPGTIVKTSAYNKDGKGEGRQSLYERMGFSTAKPGDPIYAVKGKDGTMSPVEGSKASSEYISQATKPDSMWFNEKTDLSVKKLDKEQDEFWRRLVFGD